MLTTADSARRTPKSHHTPEPEAKPKPAEARAGAFCAVPKKVSETLHWHEVPACWERQITYVGDDSHDA